MYISFHTKNLHGLILPRAAELLFQRGHFLDPLNEVQEVLLHYPQVSAIGVSDGSISAILKFLRSSSFLTLCSI